MKLSLSTIVRVTTPKIIPLAVTLFLFVVNIGAQAVAVGGSGNGGGGGTNISRNNPYSPSPSSNPKTDVPAITIVPVDPISASDVAIVQAKIEPAIGQPQAVAIQTYKTATPVVSKPLPPTENYKVGVGDVLNVNLKNTAQASGYYTVRETGTIDYPLAGDDVIVADHTVAEIEEMLASAITLYSNPLIEVKVREFASHKITIKGLVENDGETSLKREAMPLFAVRAEAGVAPKANQVLITRAPLLKSEVYDLRDADTDNILIYPGNTVEFRYDVTTERESFYIAGEVVTGGQKELNARMTLYQAVAAAGGAKGDPKKALIRRKGTNGAITITEYDLRSIRKGKTTDPLISAGDVIEIRN